MPTQRVAITAPVRAPAGYLQGMRQLGLLVQLHIEPVPDEDAAVRNAEQALAATVSAARSEPPPATSNLAARILYWVQRAQLAADWPIFEPGIALPARKDSPQDMAVIAATFEGAQGGTEALLRWVVDAFNAGDDEDALAKCMARWPALLDGLAKLVGVPSNTPRLLRAAYDLNMPLSVLDGMIFRVGQGRHARWLNSTVTDQTPQIGAHLARDKIKCAAVLRRAGMPAPRHALARTADDAVVVAERLGYPVVVKPSDLDGGVGVAAGLQSEAEVRDAFARASQHSQSILVEKHFEGRDYRLLVFHGRLIWAIDRVPGGVTGDGTRTLRQLAQAHNEDPRRQAGTNAPLKPLDIDEETLALLRRDGFTLDSVVKAGQFVRFKRASNIALGGTPTPVTPQSVHPDNAELAVRAAAVLKLDISGMDVIMEHIGRSWMETGALICEVNSGPTLGQLTTLHLYGPIVKELVNGNGRVPVAIVVGAGEPATLAHAVMQELKAGGLNAGWAAGRQVAIGEVIIANDAPGPVRAGRMLAMDPRVDAIVLFLNDMNILRTGLPFERFDTLLVAGVSAHAQEGEGAVSPMNEGQLLTVVMPACDGVRGVRSGLDVNFSQRRRGGTGDFETVESSRMAQWLAQSLLAANERHRQA